ncbi:MAG: FUSC family protein [Butyricimonas sp.]|nr:FUSC family protein [Butyricimonas sp.]
MEKKRSRMHIGLRTVKTVAAVIISMIIVNFYGSTTSKLIFAMLGAMAAVQPTFKESLESCITQIVGVLFGSMAGVFLRFLPVHPLVATGIGMIFVITFYNAFKVRFSPSLPCFIVVMVCTSPDVQPMTYAFGRIWDTAIGLSVGMLINTLIFPYDNSRQIRFTAESLDKELILFLENMFDGDDILPKSEAMSTKIDGMARQLKIFENQKLILKMKRQKEELDQFKRCEGKARLLVAEMEVLCQIGQPGKLNLDNRQRLIISGADIQDQRPFDEETEIDIVTNYHVGRILNLREELLCVLDKPLMPNEGMKTKEIH